MWAMKTIEAANNLPTGYSTSENQRTVTRLTGAVDLESTERLDREFAATTRMGTRHLTLDVSGLKLVYEPAVSSVLRGIGALRSVAAVIDIRYPSPSEPQPFEMCTPLRVIGIEFKPDFQHDFGDVEPSREGNAS